MSQPTLRIVIGTAGSGKSTIAQRLARQHGAAYLDKDAMSARFVEAALVAAGYDPGDRESNAFYRDTLLPLEYDSLLDVAGANLRIGRSVVIDAPFSPYLSDPDVHHLGRSAVRLAAGRRHRSHPRPRVPGSPPGPAARARGLERDRCQARPLGRVLGRARRTALRLGRRPVLGVHQRRTRKRNQPRTWRLDRRDDQRNDDTRRAPGISDAHLQVAADLQSVVRQERDRRSRHPHGNQDRGLPRVLPVPLHPHQHPRCAGHHAAQGDHHGAGRRDQPDRGNRRRHQRSLATRRWLPSSRSVRRRRLRPRHAAHRIRPSRKARPRTSETAASDHRSRPHWRAPV